MKVINKLESYPTGDMIVPYCPNCDNPTYSERKCPFCNTELEYEEIIEKDKEIERLNKEIIGLNNCIIEFHSEFCNKQAEINRLNNIINELEKDLGLELMKTREPNEYNKGLHNAFGYIKNKLQELKGSDK